MSKICKITGKKTIFGNNRSHAMNAKKRKFFSNIHKKKFWIPSKKKFIKLKVSKKGIKIINKYGIEYIMSKYIKEI